MDIIKKIRETVEAEGYEVAHGEESYGDDRMLGVVILVKMSERKLGDKDGPALYRAADQIKKDLQTVSAQLDPEGPAKRAACRAEIERIYRAAGVDTIYVAELPNGYCSQPCCLNKPWFQVWSSIGRVVIGWRKHVISIDWSGSCVAKNGPEMFPDEDTTKGGKYGEGGGKYIHAWGVAKAVEYIRALHGSEPSTVCAHPACEATEIDPKTRLCLRCESWTKNNAGRPSGFEGCPCYRAKENRR